jgi:small-conductance mechanosensitive channel
MWETLKNWVVTQGAGLASRILFAVILVVAGVLICRIIMKIVNKALASSKLEKAAYSLIRTLVRTVLYILLALMVASSLGVDVTGVVALASVATLAVSLALQNLLGNVIGGFTLLYTHPFGSGDYVEIAGQSGTVEEINMTYTRLATPDNKQVSIPNSAVVAAQIVNYTASGTRRVEVQVSASYDMGPQEVIDAHGGSRKLLMHITDMISFFPGDRDVLVYLPGQKPVRCSADMRVKFTGVLKGKLVRLLGEENVKG